MATKLQELLEELKGLKKYYIEVDSDCDFELVEQGRQDLIKTPKLLIKEFELDTLIAKYTETTPINKKVEEPVFYNEKEVKELLLSILADVDDSEIHNSESLIEIKYPNVEKWFELNKKK